MKLINLDNHQILAEHMTEAHTFFKRLKGLMFTKDLPSDYGLHIRPCQGVHTFFMNYSIDVLYLDETHRVLAMEEDIPPGKVGKFFPHALSAVELLGGTISRTETHVGHRLYFSKET